MVPLGCAQEKSASGNAVEDSQQNAHASATQYEWIRLPSSVDAPDSTAAATTYSAVCIARSVNPDTGQPYADGLPFSCAPEDVHHAFHLEKRTFLLGEPIIVKYTVSVEGSGAFIEAGGMNYRSRGRDDNFLFLLRREDGTWIPDVQPHAGGMGGGIGAPVTIQADKPKVHWEAVQRWCAIEAPGKYELYCFYMSPLGPLGLGPSNKYVEAGNAGDKVPPSVLMGDMPAEVTALLDDFTLPTPDAEARRGAQYEIQEHITGAVAFAKFSLVIKQGSPEAQQAMIDAWTQRYRDAVREGSDPEKSADLDGIYFTLQPFYLDAIKEEVRTLDQILPGGRYYGLCFNRSPAATAILLKFLEDDVSRINAVLQPRKNIGVMDDFIHLLNHEDEVIRQRALHKLRYFSGCYFFADPDGKPLENLSAAQMEEAAGLWWTWWRQNNADFIPIGDRGIWGYIRADGTFTIPPKYTVALDFHDGTGRVSLGPVILGSPSDLFYINKAGRKVVDVNWPNANAPLQPVKVGDAWGYKDTQGNMAIPAKFQSAGRFSEDRAPVTSGGKMGYINGQGKMVIPAKFHWAGEFQNGQALVGLNRKSALIDRYGKFIIESEFAGLGYLAEGRISFKGAYSPLFGFLDDKGKVVVEPRFSRVNEFKDGLACAWCPVDKAAWRNGRPIEHVGFIDTTGDFVIEPDFVNATSFSEGLAAVLIADGDQSKWGYINRSGEFVIPASFDSARPFSEGLAAVLQDGKWGFIDQQGEFVIPSVYVDVGSFSEGLAPVNVDSPYWHLDPKDYR